MIQYRRKQWTDAERLHEAKQVVAVCHRANVPCIINDAAHVTRVVAADGLHLGQDDMPLDAARTIVAPNTILGQSTHSVDQAQQALLDGADYIGVGPIFATPTKPRYEPVGVQLIRAVVDRIKIPWVAIGGIDLTTIDQVLEAGATRVAVVRAIAGAPNIEQAARAMKQRLNAFVRV